MNIVIDRCILTSCQSHLPCEWCLHCECTVRMTDRENCIRCCAWTFLCFTNKSNFWPMTICNMWTWQPNKVVITVCETFGCGHRHEARGWVYTTFLQLTDWVWRHQIVFSFVCPHFIWSFIHLFSKIYFQPEFFYAVKCCQATSTVTLQPSWVRKAICAHSFVNCLYDTCSPTPFSPFPYSKTVKCNVLKSLPALCSALSLWMKEMLMSYNSTVKVYKTWNDY